MQIKRKSVQGLLMVILSLAVVFGLGLPAYAQKDRRAVGMETGCIDWNIEQGCVLMSSCFVWSDGGFDCRYFSIAAGVIKEVQHSE